MHLKSFGVIHVLIISTLCNLATVEENHQESRANVDKQMSFYLIENYANCCGWTIVVFKVKQLSVASTLDTPELYIHYSSYAINTSFIFINLTQFMFHLTHLFKTRSLYLLTKLNIHLFFVLTT